MFLMDQWAHRNNVTQNLLSLSSLTFINYWLVYNVQEVENAHRLLWEKQSDAFFL